MIELEADHGQCRVEDVIRDSSTEVGSTVPGRFSANAAWMLNVLATTSPAGARIGLGAEAHR